MLSRQAGTSHEIQSHVLLKPYTTFKIGGPAAFFAHADSLDELRDAIDFAHARAVPIFVLGGGSNILVSDRGFDGMVIHPVRRGVSVVDENEDAVCLHVNAAETWDDVVAFTAERNWWGLENLSHIPGHSGAALVQNIGAYGQQISDVLDCANVVDLSSDETQTLTAGECGFGYRRSIFNSSARGSYFIFGYTLRLSKRPHPNLHYADVRDHFTQRGILNPAQSEIRSAIIGIRDRKFPFPREECGGNVGSFFKNLVLTQDDYHELEARIKTGCDAAVAARLRSFRDRRPGSEAVKIPAAFLIEICGLKGFQMRNVLVNEAQALVLLNAGGATAADVLLMAQHIRRTVLERTGVRLLLEPELVGFSPSELSAFEHLEYTPE
jgi:UDP-N-acetylmuramate dehydrogenase